MEASHLGIWRQTKGHVSSLLFLLNVPRSCLSQACLWNDGESIGAGAGGAGEYSLQLCCIESWGHLLQWVCSQTRPPSPTPTFPLETNIAALATEKALDETCLEHRLVFYLSLCYCNPDFLGWWGDQSMNRFDLLSLYEMKLEPFNEDSKKHEPFSDWEPPSGTFTFTSKPKRLVSEAWKLFNVLWTETIRIKPEKYCRVSFFFIGKSYLTFCS